MPEYENTEKQYQRVEDDDPERCQAVTTRGQCKIKSLPGSKYCPIHGRHSKIGIQNAEVRA
jgi:hypothetical protein